MRLSKGYFLNFAAAGAVASLIAMTGSGKPDEELKKQPEISDASRTPARDEFDPSAHPYKFLKLQDRVESPDFLKAYDDFCIDNEGRCVTSKDMRSVVMEDWVEKLLADTNRRINKQIHYKSDEEVYGTDDKWAIAKDDDLEAYGDCDDYAVSKREALVKHIPPNAMMLAYVRTEEDEAHAVLIVRTDRGDKILDNRFERVMDLDQTGYDYKYVTDPLDNTKWREVGYTKPMLAMKGGRVLANVAEKSDRLGYQFSSISQLIEQGGLSELSIVLGPQNIGRLNSAFNQGGDALGELIRSLDKQSEQLQKKQEGDGPPLTVRVPVRRPKL